jgi:hypothetical protein
MEGLTFNGLHGVISQKREFFITTAVITSNPIGYKELNICFEWYLLTETTYRENFTERPFCNSSHDGFYLKKFLLLGHFHRNIQSSLHKKNETDLEH